MTLLDWRPALEWLFVRLRHHRRPPVPAERAPIVPRFFRHRDDWTAGYPRRRRSFHAFWAERRVAKRQAIPGLGGPVDLDPRAGDQWRPVVPWRAQ